MINRRSLLIATGALALNYGLTGCRTGQTAALRIRLLEGSVPTQILQEFQRRVQIGTTEFLASEQLADLFALLQTWKNPDAKQNRANAQPMAIADLVTLGDYWLTAAIQQQLIQPLTLETFAGWQQIPPRWQQLVRRNSQGQLDPAGQLWAAPYRWGSLVIAYNQEKLKPLGWTPTDWKDLWRPELRGNLSLPDNARSVIGLTLKKLGQSINTEDPEALPDLAAELQSLHQQVKFYSSNAYLQPLLLEDTWLTVGWSTEVLPVVERDSRLTAVVPESGTILTADLWVRPAPAAPASTQPTSPEPTSPELTSPTAPPSPDTAPTITPAARAAAATEFQKWIEFCWQPSIASQLSLLSQATSPIVLSEERTQLPTALQQNSLLLPPASVIERSEFLLPITNLEAYRRLWVTMRQTE